MWELCSVISNDSALTLSFGIIVYHPLVRLQLQLQMYNLLRREASRRCEVATQLVKTLKILLTRQVHNKNKGSRQTQGPAISTGHGCANMYMVRDRRGTGIVQGRDLLNPSSESASLAATGRLFQSLEVLERKEFLWSSVLDLMWGRLFLAPERVLVWIGMGTRSSGTATRWFKILNMRVHLASRRLATRLDHPRSSISWVTLT